MNVGHGLIFHLEISIDNSRRRRRRRQISHCLRSPRNAISVYRLRHCPDEIPGKSDGPGCGHQSFVLDRWSTLCLPSVIFSETMSVVFYQWSRRIFVREWIGERDLFIFDPFAIGVMSWCLNSSSVRIGFFIWNKVSRDRPWFRWSVQAVTIQNSTGILLSQNAIRAGPSHGSRTTELYS